MIDDLDPRIIRRLADAHAVYRMYGHVGELLYVGKTGHLHRFDSHAMRLWFPLVVEIKLAWYPHEAAARVAERHAIQTEHPRYNIDGNPRVTGRRVKPVQHVPRQVEDVRDLIDPPPDLLADVLAVLGDKPGMHWQAIAPLLAARFPERHRDATAESVSAQCRAAGVQSVDVKYLGRSAMGCRREHILRLVADREVAP